MSGYRELQDAYEKNHEVTVLRRQLTRDAVNGLQFALLTRLGINDQNSDIVAFKAQDGGELFPRLAILEIGDVLRVTGEIAVKGISAAPPTKFMFDLSVSYRQERIVVEVVGMEPFTVNETTDLHKLADSIFERLLLKLNKY